jgi:Na+-transporting methylmalonyl-CoA/oxaloacetate decarboxylase gamma subunit
MQPLLNSLPLAATVTAEQARRAVEIAAVGMLMVFAALTLLVVFLTLLPRILAVIGTVWPETSDDHGAPDPDQFPDEEDEVLAGIGFVLHAEFREQT